MDNKITIYNPPYSLPIPNIYNVASLNEVITHSKWNLVIFSVSLSTNNTIRPLPNTDRFNDFRSSYCIALISCFVSSVTSISSVSDEPGFLSKCSENADVISNERNVDCKVNSTLEFG